MTAASPPRKRGLDVVLSIVCVVVALWVVWRDGWSLSFSWDMILGFALAQALIFLQWQTVVLRSQALFRAWGVLLPDPVLKRILALSLVAGYALFGSLGQIVSRVVLFVREGVTWPIAAATTLIDRLLQLIILITLTSLSFVGAWLVQPSVLRLPEMRLDVDVMAWGVVAFVTVVIVLSVVVVWQRLLSPALRGKIDLKPAEDQLAQSLSLAALWSFVGLLLHMSAALVLLAPALDQAHPLALLAVICVTMLLSSLPISIGGWGVRELTMVVGLSQIGVNPDQALVASIALGLFSLVPAVPVLLRSAVVEKSAPSS